MENFIAVITLISDSFGVKLMARFLRNSETPGELFSKMEKYLDLCHQKDQKVLEWNTYGINHFTLVSKSNNHFLLKYHTCGASEFHLYVTRTTVKWKVNRRGGSEVGYRKIFELTGNFNKTEDLWVNRWAWERDDRYEELRWLDEYQIPEEYFVVKRLPKGVRAYSY